MRNTGLLASVSAISIIFWTAVSIPGTAQVAPPSEERPGETITLKIEGWSCASCEKDIRRALLAVPGVKRADVSYARGGAVVEVEPNRVSSEHLVQAVESAGNILSSYRASVVTNGTLTEQASGQGKAGSWLWNLFR